MKRYIHILLTVFIICGIFILPTNKAFSQGSSKKSAFSNPWKVVPFERKAFIENKGQFDKLIPEDKKGFSYCIDKGQQVFFYSNRLSYRFNRTTYSKAPLWGFFETEEQKEERIRNTKKSTQYIDIEWLGSNQNTSIVAENKQSTYYSYVTNVSNENPQTIFCDGYSKITYKNLYPNIDVEYVFHPENGIKYNLLLHPGADISQVKMKYGSNVKLSVKNGNIHIKTIVGEIIDHAPVTFYAENNENIPSAFKLENNTVSFDIQHITSNKEVVIDPWSVVPGFTGGRAFDNGTDNIGNVYVYGGAQNAYVVEKYPPTGGAPIWSLSASGIDQNYYGDMLVEAGGNFYLSEGFRSGGAYTYKYDPSSALIWQSTNSGIFQEHWRMAINCLTQKVILAGGGTTSPTQNIAEIEVATGLLTNVKSSHGSHEDMAGICVDDLGQVYMVGGISNLVFFTDNTNSTIATAPNGYNLSEIGVGGTPSYHDTYSANGYSMMALGGTDFLFTSDGAKVIKWDRNTHSIITSAIIPGGQQNMGAGVLADKCNNLFVGTSNGVYRFDFNLVQKEYKSTTTAVFDIAYASNGDIVASGDGFLQTLPFGREACGAAVNEVTTDPCNAEINTVKIIPSLGVPPFTFLWDDGNTDSVRTNLSLGDHIVTIKDASCSPSFFIDTVTIGGTSSSMTITKTNPLCTYSSDGIINISLLSNQDIVGIVWTPTVTNSLLNDSTSQATGLPSGTYNCFITSSLGCSFDTTVTLVSQFANPSSSFFDAQACQNQPILFDENSSSNVGTINSWNWNFGDNTATSNSQNPSHTYTTAGTFTTTLIIGTTNGCFDTVQKQTIIHPIPTPDFYADDICQGSIAYFIEASNILPPSIIQYWQWDFGDNTSFKNNQNTTHLFQNTGTYNVELTATSNFGCKDSITKPITVNPNPTVTFTASDTINCSPLCVNFQSTVALSSGTIATYLWNYGDLGAFDNTENGSHCYNNATGNTTTPQPLLFDVSITVTTDNGCMDIAQKPSYITVLPNPVANFTATPQKESIISPAIEIIDLSMGPITWLWNFGDDSTSTTPTPGEYNYTDTGTYVIGLNILNQYGCADSTYRTVIIEPDWAFFVPNAFSPNGDGINDTFGGNGYGVLEYQMFIFDRWGNRVFDTDSMQKPWTGKANLGASIAQMDVYVYKISIKDSLKKKHEFTGTVTLVR